jgi:CheY-like chemotaxis protein
MNAVISNRRVLVVDDEPLVRQTLDFCLRDDYSVAAVSSGEEAVEAVRNEAFPVVILDLCMEGLSGIETLVKLREIREHQNVIILTAYQTIERAVSALNLGAFCFLSKPFEQAQLKDAVARGVDAFDHQVMREREMKERLLHVHDEFFSMLCHEFNTPMNIVLGFSDLLAASVTDPEQSLWVEEIRKSATHLHGVLMEIVDYTAVAHNAVAGRVSSFCPQELLFPLIAQFSPMKIDLQVAEGFSASKGVTGPSDSVLLIARKMFRMASHAGSTAVHVQIGLDAPDSAGKGDLRIEVRGTDLSRASFGPGSFSRFLTGFRYAGANGAGPQMVLGLELATCRKIAEYAGGTIEVIPDGMDGLGLLAKVPVRCAAQF